MGPLGEEIVLKYWAKVATRDDVIYGEVYELIHDGLSCVADDDHQLDLYIRRSGRTSYKIVQNYTVSFYRNY